MRQIKIADIATKWLAGKSGQNVQAATIFQLTVGVLIGDRAGVSWLGSGGRGG